MKRNKVPQINKKVTKENCLTCKYEPEWSEWVGSEIYKRKIGKCKKRLALPKNAPPVYTLTENVITRYSDDSGIYSSSSCKSWEPKI